MSNMIQIKRPLRQGGVALDETFARGKSVYKKPELKLRRTKLVSYHKLTMFLISSTVLSG